MNSAIAIPRIRPPALTPITVQVADLASRLMPSLRLATACAVSPTNWAMRPSAASITGSHSLCARSAALAFSSGLLASEPAFSTGSQPANTAFNWSPMLLIWLARAGSSCSAASRYWRISSRFWVAVLRRLALPASVASVKTA
jgi:hypothetical protein